MSKKGSLFTSGLTGPKIIVAAGLAERCEVQVAHAIGVAQAAGLGSSGGAGMRSPEAVSA